MRLHISFDVGNAVYRDGDANIRSIEVANTLRSVARTVELNGTLGESSLRNTSRIIVDPNGNTVGRWTFVDDAAADINHVVVTRCLQQANRNEGQQNRKVVTDND
jgi:hypothetical protein